MFDPAKPQQLMNDLDVQSVREIIYAFLSEIPSRLTELEEMAIQPPGEPLARWAHSMQGICLSFGLVGLGLKLQALEQAILVNDAKEIRSLASEIPEAAHRSISPLREWLAQLAQ